MKAADPDGDDQEPILGRLRQFFAWDLASVGAGVLFVAFSYFWLHLHFLRVVGLGILLDVPLLIWARHLAMRQRLVASMFLVCAGLWAMLPTIAYFLPCTSLFLGMLCIWPVVVPLPFITGRPLKLIMALSTVMALLTTVAAMHAQPEAEKLPSLVVAVTNAVAVPLMTGLVSLVLWHYNARLNETIDRTRTANAALRESERSLERRVRQRTAELSEARDAALAATRAKSTFLANMSHELRTPLNAILGYTEMLQEQSLEQGRNELVPDLLRVHAAGRHLLALINDVLDLSKVESGRMDLTLESFSVSGLVREVTELIRPMVKPAVTLEVRFDGTLDKAYADPVKLRQALFNLLSNACKFTAAGGIQLEVGQSPSAPGGGRLWFRVSDTGIGMTAEELGQIFQSFAQANPSTARRYGGTGLGLAISRRFCELMGGDISVQSERDRGSTFTLTIPAVVRPADRTEAPPRRPTLENRARSLLVIDNDAPSRDLLRRFLEKEGHEVHVAHDGEAGLRLARSLHPDLITLEVMMPQMDGWTFLALIKQDRELEKIPIIVVTVQDQREEAMARGAADALIKPVDRERLLAIVTSQPPGPRAARAPLLVDDDPKADRELSAAHRRAEPSLPARES